jgi:hypothetical protein
MSIREWADGQQNGGFNSYPDRVTGRIFYKKDVPVRTAPETIASGQVILAGTFLERSSTSPFHLTVHGGISETAKVTINAALANADTLTVGTGGIVFTVGSAGATIAKLVDAISVLQGGDSTTTANAALLAAGVATTVGTFTSGTAPAFRFNKSDTNTAIATATTIASDVTNLAVTASAGAAPTVTVVAGTATFNKIAGVTIYDVDATSAAVDVEVYKQASFYANDDGNTFLRWANDPEELMTKADGTTVATTTYNTGASGTSAAANNLKKKFVEGSRFEELGFINIGDQS